MTLTVKHEIRSLPQVLRAMLQLQITGSNLRPVNAWNQDQAALLLDSLEQDLPMGTLTLVQPTSSQPTASLLDGRARMGTLLAMLTDADCGWVMEANGLPYIAEGEPSTTQFPLAALLDTMPYLAQVRRIEALDSPEGAALLARAQQLATTLHHYRFPVTTVIAPSDEQLAKLVQRVDYSPSLV